MAVRPWTTFVGLACGLAVAGCGASDRGTGAEYVGGATCAGCHEGESALWRGSHHDLARQEAGEGAVLGDFDDATFTHFDVTTTFSRTLDKAASISAGSARSAASRSSSWALWPIG